MGANVLTIKLFVGCNNFRFGFASEHIKAEIVIQTGRKIGLVLVKIFSKMSRILTQGFDNEFTEFVRQRVIDMRDVLN